LDVKKRFSEEQIIGFLREAESGLAVADHDAHRLLDAGEGEVVDLSPAATIAALQPLGPSH
jgi:hypothetical protein